MANKVKYNDVNWGEGYSIAGERMATNSHYTGEHLGTPMQSAIDDAANEPHFLEAATVRYGTMMGDAGDKKFPTVKAES